MLEQELFNLLEGTSDAAFAVSDQGESCFWNKAPEKLFGYTASEVRNKTCYDIARNPLDPVVGQQISDDTSNFVLLEAVPEDFTVAAGKLLKQKVVSLPNQLHGPSFAALACFADYVAALSAVRLQDSRCAVLIPAEWSMVFWHFLHPSSHENGREKKNGILCRRTSVKLPPAFEDMAVMREAVEQRKAMMAACNATEITASKCEGHA